MKNIKSTVNALSYLSRARNMMLRLSFLGIIVGFGVCSNQLHALKIKNGLEKDLKVTSVSEGEYRKKRFWKPQRGKKVYVIPSGDILYIKNELEPSRFGMLLPVDEHELSEEQMGEYGAIPEEVSGQYVPKIHSSNVPSFKSLNITVEYDGKEYILETGPLPKEVTKSLNKVQRMTNTDPKKDVKVVIKKPEEGPNTMIKIQTYYFNQDGKVDELNARFEPAEKLR